MSNEGVGGAATTIEYLLPLIVGIIAGFIATFLGLGGGVVMVPLLVFAGVPIKVAVPASLFAIMGTSLGGLRRLFRGGLVNIRVAVFLESGSMLGALIGSWLFQYIPSFYLQVFLGLLLLGSAVVFARKGTIVAVSEKEAVEQIRPSGIRWTAAWGASLGAGMLSALLGIGGGALKVPVMVTILAVPIHVAVSTSKLMVGITAATALIGHAVHESVDWGIAFALGLGTFSGASVASRLLVRTSRKQLYLLATLYYLLTGVYLVVSAFNG